MDRRRVLVFLTRWLIWIGLAFLAWPFLAYLYSALVPVTPADRAATAALAPVPAGEFRWLTQGSRRVLVLHLTPAQWAATQALPVRRKAEAVEEAPQPSGADTGPYRVFVLAAGAGEGEVLLSFLKWYANGVRCRDFRVQFTPYESQGEPLPGALYCADSEQALPAGELVYDLFGRGRGAKTPDLSRLGYRLDGERRLLLAD